MTAKIAIDRFDSAEALLIGGPMDGKVISVSPQHNILETPAGRYHRQQITPKAAVFVFQGPAEPPSTPTPPKADRWARKKRPNPFPSPAR